MNGTEVGRLPVSRVGKVALHDAPNEQIAAMLSNQDAIITALKAIAAKLDADTGTSEIDYAATITDALKVLDLHL
jgi:hypothetical protein